MLTNSKFTIDFIYAFYDDKVKDEYAIYLMLYLKHEDLLMLSKAWRLPKNVSKEGFLDGDYTSIFWETLPQTLLWTVLCL
ncbi:hypothetical protein AMQ68_12685 [Chryseobacterium sp. ERMR1:04]|nr:hypothetical protein AMQ68_12685 [Chryseobacterium sp. ERMR1:04]